MLKLHIINLNMYGSSVLVTTPTHNILVDLAFQSGSQAMLNYLKRLEITHLDAVILTHPHRDHINGDGGDGLQSFIDNFTIGEVWSNGIPTPLWYDGITVSPYGASAIHDYEMVLDQIWPSGWSVAGEFDYPGIEGVGTPLVPYKEPRAGDVHTFGELSIRVLNPFKPHKQANTNTSSMVLQLTYQGKKIMLCADSLFDSENDILNNFAHNSLKSDILYLGHHGMDNATSTNWYDVVNPTHVTLHRRDALLPNRIHNLIQSNGAIYYDPYQGEDFFSPNSNNFISYVFEVDASGIEVESFIFEHKMVLPMIKLNGKYQAKGMFVKNNVTWVPANGVAYIGGKQE